VADLQRKLAAATIKNQQQQEQLLQRPNPASLQPLQSPQPPQPPPTKNQAYEMQPPPTTKNKC